jgi:hypothetical protein
VVWLLRVMPLGVLLLSPLTLPLTLREAAVAAMARPRCGRLLQQALSRRRRRK